jgi:hypothetical protein
MLAEILAHKKQEIGVHLFLQPSSIAEDEQYTPSTQRVVKLLKSIAT